jgi:hypothetical protein
MKPQIIMGMVTAWIIASLVTPHLINWLWGIVQAHADATLIYDITMPNVFAEWEWYYYFVFMGGIMLLHVPYIIYLDRKKAKQIKANE